MIIDAQNSFSATTNGAITGDSPTATGSTPSTNIIDLGVQRDVGSAVTEDLQLLVEVIAAFTSGGAGTLQVQLQMAPDSGGSPGTWATIYQSDVIALATLVQGYKFLEGGLLSQAVAANAAQYRFMRVNYVIGTAVMTAGTLVAALTPALQHSPSYKAGY
jgi:hypothetical protein